MKADKILKKGFSLFLFTLTAFPLHGITFDPKYNPIWVKTTGNVEQSGTKGSFLFQLENDLLWESKDLPLISTGQMKNWAFTSASSAAKKGIIIRNSDLALFGIRANYELLFDGLAHLRLQNNSSEDDSFISLIGATLSVCRNEDVLIERNKAYGAYISQSGGAILDHTGSTIILGDNTHIKLSQNSITNSQLAQGGAIATGYTGLLSIHHNDELTISRNAAIGTKQGYGGAIFVSSESDVQIVQNGAVLISGNHAEGTSVASGGALFCDGNLVIAGNQSVIFENNYESTNDTITLRSIHITELYQNKKLELSAQAGQHITFYDSLKVGVNTDVHLNADGIDLLGNTYTGGGNIIFSGAKTQQHLETLLNRPASQEELNNSRCSEIRNTTHLHAGKLILQEHATLKTFGLTAHTGKEAQVVLDNGHLDSAGHDIELQNGTTLQLSGKSSVQAQTLTVQSGAKISFALDAAMQETNTLQFSGNLVLNPGAILHLNNNGIPEDGATYALLTTTGLGASSLSGVLIEGLDATIDDFYWQNGTLYYQFSLPDLHLATWAGTNGCIWDTTQKNWQQGNYTYAYANGTSVCFNDTGCGTVQIVGDLTPQQVLVNNSSGHDYRWESSPGGGKLAGSMKLLKQGTGDLYICHANTYSGGTELSCGTLTSLHEHALGSGNINLLGGTLRANSKLKINAGQKLIFDGGAAAGEIESTPNAIITLQQDATFLNGTLTLAGGSLQLQQHHLMVDGTLHLAKETQLDVREYGSIGVYNLITWQQQTGDLELLKLQTAASTLRYTTMVHGNSLMLHITGDSLKWHQPTGIWANNTPGGWESGYFTPGEAVLFENGGTATLEGVLMPSSIHVSGSKTTRFTGAGCISGTTTLTKNDSGTLYLETNNDFSGKIIINDGIVVAAHPHALGVADIELNNATLQTTSPLELKQNLQMLGGIIDGSARITPAARLNVRTSGTVQGDLHLQGGSLLLQEVAKLRVKGRYHQHSGNLQLNRYSQMNIMGDMCLQGGNLSLACGSSIAVNGSLTLGGNTRLILESGAFAGGDVLIRTQGPLTGDLSSLSLIYEENLGIPSDAVYELRFIDNNVVLYRYPDEIPFPSSVEPTPVKYKHNELSLANWGVALASRLFVETLRSNRQHSEILGENAGSVWMSGFGGYLCLNEVYYPEVYVTGAALGIDFVYGNDHTMGIAIGATYGTGSSDDLDLVEQTGTLFALYGNNPLHYSANNKDIIMLNWSIAGGKYDSAMEDGNAAISPWSVQTDAQLNWEHVWGESFSSHLFTGVQHLMVSRDSTDEFETSALSYLRAEIGAGFRWTISDSIILYTESNYLSDIMRHNPTTSRNPGRRGCCATIGIQEHVRNGVFLQAHYSWERVQHAIRHSAHAAIHYFF